ncbi:MAG: glutamate--tRNA ligase [Anaerolineales bacterium]|nr:glutamate--tRNA ligase [Anaerolineales bacterium]
MNHTLKPTRVRFAPSPTGRTHIGSARTALYDYLLARQTGGQFILRIEDTDQKRSTPGAEAELLASLRWLGLQWDEGPEVGGPYGPYHQSQRKDIYQQYARQLVESGHAYYCFCTPDRLARIRQEQQKRKAPIHYDGTCRKLNPDEAAQRVARGERYVIRFKIPEEGSITVLDALRGGITVENSTLDDFILVKSDGWALYHLAAMVDDHLMKITHVMRGSEWLSTFPLHVHVVRAFGWEEPVWVHLSIFLKPSGKGKMSKRDVADLLKDGFSIYVTDLRDMGFLPEAIINWVALMGWSYDDQTEFFTLPDLVEKFSLEKLNPAPAAINISKLDYFNGVHIRTLEAKDLASRLKPFFVDAGYKVEDEKLLRIMPIVRTRLTTLDDASVMAGFFFRDEVNPDPKDLIGKNMTVAQSAEAARQAYQLMAALPQISVETAEQPMRCLAEKLGLTTQQLFGILRIAVTGQAVSPPLFESMEIIGKETVLKRIHNAIELLLEL